MSVVHQGQPPSYQEARILAAVTLPTPAPAEDNGSAPALITVSQASDVGSIAEEHKQAIYKHPLFPLMALVFEKCEMSSTGLDSHGRDYDSDIQSFVEHARLHQHTFVTEDPDLDQLMVGVVQVLRIHLMELEKVSELCKDFCSRYISCLKGKLQSDHLLRLDDLDSPPLSPTSEWTGSGGGVATLTPNPLVGGMSQGLVVQQPSLAMATISQGQIISGNMVYQMVHTPQGIVAQPIQIQASPLQTAMGTTPVIQGTTPLSQIGVVGSPITTQQTTVSLAGSGSLSGDEFDDDDPKRRNTKRGVLPKHATQIMKTWLFQHLVHPYPTEDEKRHIATQTNLTLLQVNNWFINARRRILQPMLDGGGGGDRAKKTKVTAARPMQKFWPHEIASITPQLPPPRLPPSSPPSSSPQAVTANGSGAERGEGAALQDTLVLSFGSETSSGD